MRMADERDAYIAEHIGDMTTREMAAALGVNQSTVVRRAQRLGLTPPKGSRGKAGRKPRPKTSSAPRAARTGESAVLMDSPRDEWLKRMRNTRDVLRDALERAEDKDVARIAKEYRATCDAVRREEESDVDGKPDALSDIVALFGNPNGLPGADVANR